MKQEIRLEFNKNFKMITPIYKLPDDKKEIIVNDDLNKMFQDDIFCTDDEYEHNNVPNYYLFNKCVFNIFKEVEIMEYAYTIVASKWVVVNYQFPTIDEYLECRSKWLTDTYLDKTCEDINDECTFDLNERDEEN